MQVIDVFTEIIEVIDAQSDLFIEAMSFFESQLGPCPEWAPEQYYAILDLSCGNEPGRIGHAKNHEHALEIALSHVALRPGDEGQALLLGMCPCKICGSTGELKAVRIRIVARLVEGTAPAIA